MNKDTASQPGDRGDAGTDVFDELPLPCIELDAHGVITRANRATYAMHPPERGSLIGLLAWESMPTDQQQQACAAYMTLMETGGPTPPAVRNIYVSTGEFRTFEMHRRLMLDAAGKPVGMRIVSVDVTEDKRRREEEQIAHFRLESAIASLPAAVVVTDALGSVTLFNAAAEELLGWSAAEAVGAAIEEVVPLLEYTCDEGEMLNHRLTLEKPTTGIALVPDRSRKALRVEIRTAPMIDKKSGVTTGVCGFLRKLDEAD
jgi:PAS domain S-box-containing protein